MNGWRRAAFPLLTVTLLAAGCAGLPAADRPSRLPIGTVGSASPASLSPTASASSTSSASPSVPVPPTASPSGSEAEQVEAAVRHYFDVANKATATGDTKPLAALSVPKCGCRQLVRYIDGEYQKGHIEGSLATIVQLRDTELHVRLAAMTVVFHVATARTVASDGRVVSTATAGSATDRMILIQLTDGSWLVSDVINLGRETDK